APTANYNGGGTAPNNETPVATADRFPSNGNTEGMSRIKRASTNIVEPVTILVVRVNGSTWTATFPLKKIKPAYVNADRIPKTKPLIGKPCMSPFKIFEAKKTPIKISMIDKTVTGAGFILLKIHSKIIPIQTNWNIRM